jgi:small subunit ribosomal protein S6e
MRADFEGSTRRRLLLTEGVGYHPTDYPGKRKRQSVRGNRVSAEIIQVNLSVAKAGSKPVGDHFANLASQEKKA